MKRPRFFYLVAVWCSLALFLQTNHLTQSLRARQGPGEPLSLAGTLLTLLAFCFAVWQTVGLVRLKPFNRWFAVVFLVWWAGVLLWNVAVFLRTATTEPGGASLVLVPIILFFAVIFTLNLLSAWCLSRRTFRQIAVPFVVARAHGRQASPIRKTGREGIPDHFRR